ncbi:MAG: sensor histidine kinase [Pseudolabrys sp.]
MSVTTNEPAIQLPVRRALGIVRRQHQQKLDAMAAELQASMAREQVLLSDKLQLSQRAVMLAQEFEHRLVNGLQLVVSLLSLQSRAAPTPEASAQLTIAARRVSALGRVHRQLHLLDHQDKVEFKQYLTQLCDDLSSLLLEAQAGYTIIVEGNTVEIPTASAIPLGFIVNELITNSVKYANGHITVRIGSTSPTSHSLSVLDDGPGMPAEFDVASSKGLGMRIVQSLVQQIGGTFETMPGDGGRGTKFTVTFATP